MERNWKGKLSKCETRERTGKLSNYFREERKGLLSKIIGQMTMYGKKGKDKRIHVDKVKDESDGEEAVVSDENDFDVNNRFARLALK